MANYKVEYDFCEDKVTKTLVFMNKKYEEIWTENNTFCNYGLDGLVENDYPDLPDETLEAVRNITGVNEDEVMEYLETLTDYEQNQSN